MIFCIALALAGVPEDLAIAADVDQPRALRESAFGRLAEPTATDRVLGLIADAETTSDHRWVLIRSLGANPSSDAREALLRFTEDKNPLTRMAAVGGLGDRKDGDVATRVAAKLTDPAILVRASAVDALTRLRDPRTLPDLDRALQDPTNRYRGTSLWVRRRMVEAISAIGTDAAIHPLATALNDDDPEVVGAALKGLETVAGFSYKEGRTPSEELEAWARWTKGR